MSKADRQLLWGVFVSCLPRLIGFLLALLACFLITLCCGCKSQKIVTETIERVDTLHVRHDSIIVRDRFVPVEVQIPPSVQVIEKILESSDSTSVLEDDYYKSMARVSGGKLQHTLQSKPDARLLVPVIVHDTIKVTQDTLSTQNTQKQHDTEIKEVNKLTWWQSFLVGLGQVVLIALGLVLGYFVVKKIRSR